MPGKLRNSEGRRVTVEEDDESEDLIETEDTGTEDDEEEEMEDSQDGDYEEEFAEDQEMLEIEEYKALSTQDLVVLLKNYIDNLKVQVESAYADRKKYNPPPKKNTDDSRCIYAMESDYPKLLWLFEELSTLPAEDSNRGRIIYMIDQVLKPLQESVHESHQNKSFDPTLVLSPLVKGLDYCLSDISMNFLMNFSLNIDEEEEDEEEEEEEEEEQDDLEVVDMEEDEEEEEEEGPNEVFDILLTDLVETEAESEIEAAELQGSVYAAFKNFFGDFTSYLERIGVKTSSDLIQNGDSGMYMSLLMVNQLFQCFHKALEHMKNKPEKKLNRKRCVYLFRTVKILREEITTETQKSYLNLLASRMENMLNVIECDKILEEYVDWKLIEVERVKEKFSRNPATKRTYSSTSRH